MGMNLPLKPALTLPTTTLGILPKVVFFLKLIDFKIRHKPLILRFYLCLMLTTSFINIASIVFNLEERTVYVSRGS
jgi:hypothetical protein